MTASPTPPLTVSPKSEPSATSVATGTLLLVEDQELIAGYLTQAFGSAGFSVLCAGDGASALRIVAEPGSTVRLAMIDCGLPDMPGDELCLRLRAVRPEFPVILTSGHEPPGCVEKLSESGPTWFAAKPYRLGPLIARVRALMATSA